MNLKVLALIFLLLLKLVVLDGCMPHNTKNEVSIDSDTYVCMTLSPIIPGSNMTYLRLPNVLKSDNLASLTMEYSWNSSDYNSDYALRKLNISQTEGQGLGVAIESMGIMSSRKAYRITTSVNDTSGSITFPLLFAIIHVHKGKVKKITWDDNCNFCDQGSCDFNTYTFEGTVITDTSITSKSCYIKDTTCTGNDVASTNALCQLQVFVSWTGTDKNGRKFESAANRFSRLSVDNIVEYTDNRLNKNSIY